MDNIPLNLALYTCFKQNFCRLFGLKTDKINLFLKQMDMHILIKNMVFLYKKWANLYKFLSHNLVRCNNFVTDLLTKGGEQYIIKPVIN